MKYLYDVFLPAERSGVVLGAETGVFFRPMQTGASIGTEVFFTHVQLFLTVHTCVPCLTGALIAEPGDGAVAADAGTRIAGVYEDVAAPPGPLHRTAAVVGVEKVLALPVVQTRVGLAHGRPPAADERGGCRRLDELLLLQTWEIDV